MESVICELDLLNALNSKSESGLILFIDCYSRYIHAIVHRITFDYASKEDIEEAVSDILIKIWRNSEKIDLKKGNLKSYISAISRNYSFDMIKKLKDIHFELDENFLSDCFDPADEICIKEEYETLLNAISALNADEKEMIIRRYFFGETIKKIASHFETSEKSVESKLYRSRKKLKQIMQGGMNNE